MILTLPAASTMSLVELCKYGHLEGVKAALQRGVDVNTKGDKWIEHGQTGLMWAVENHYNSVVELLLKTPNIDVNLKEDGGWSALHRAVSRRNNEALKLLLNVQNIDVNIVTNNGYSAVHLAVSKNKNSTIRC